jgi:hypothetical protein
MMRFQFLRGQMNHYIRDREEFFNRSIFSPARSGWIEIDFLFTYWTPDPCVRTCSRRGGLLDSLPRRPAWFATSDYTAPTWQGSSAAAVAASASRGDGRNQIFREGAGLGGRRGLNLDGIRGWSGAVVMEGRGGGRWCRKDTGGGRVRRHIISRSHLAARARRESGGRMRSGGGGRLGWSRAGGRWLGWTGWLVVGFGGCCVSIYNPIAFQPFGP